MPALPSVRTRPRRRLPALLATLTAAALALTGCGATPTAVQTLQPSMNNTLNVQSGLEYWTDGTNHLLLDACLPAGHFGKRASVILIHSGGLKPGLRNDPTQRDLCTSLARWGMAAFSIDYRPSGAYPYPAQVDDVTNALTWLRKAKQVRRFGLDPTRFALLGSTVGGNVALEAGMRGAGAQTTGTRVKAVIAISGMAVMTPQAETLGRNTGTAVELAKNYLGCTNLTPTSCRNAQAASAITAVDKTDPATLLINGADELTPVQQAQTMQKALETAKVPVQLIVVPGALHGLALLSPAVRRNLHQFLTKYL
ncbi:MAG: alpha/beta hydrolase [Amnibacterium sp.]